MMFAIVLTILGIGTAILLRYLTQPRNGPISFPAFGNFFQVMYYGNGQLHMALDKLAEIFGETFQLSLGDRCVYVISSEESLMKAELAEDVNILAAFDIMPQSMTPNIIQRHLVIKPERHDNALKYELLEIIASLKSMMADGHSAVFLNETVINPSAMNIAWARIMSTEGQRLLNACSSSSAARSVVEKTFSVQSSLKMSTLAVLFPVMRKMFPGRSGEASRLKAFNELISSIQDFVQSEQSCEQATPFNFLCSEYLTFSTVVSSVISYGLLYLALNPSIQKEAFEEIDQNSSPTEVYLTQKDMERFPNTTEKLSLIMRRCTAVPVSVYSKKGSNNLVLVNWHTIIKNAEEDDDGANNRLVSTCAKLVRPIALQYITTLVKSFKFSIVPGHLSPTLDLEGTVLRQLKPFNLVVSIRE